MSDSLATSSGENGDNLRIFLASNLDRVQQHLRLELTKKQQEKEDYERLIQELAVSELEEKESQNEKVSSSVQKFKDCLSWSVDSWSQTGCLL